MMKYFVKERILEEFINVMYIILMNLEKIN